MSTGINKSVAKKIWIFSGDLSGDQYGGYLARELKRLSPSLRIFGMGGRVMRENGVEIVVDAKDLGVMGFIEVIRHYPRLQRIFYSLLEQVKKDPPDLVIFIDYPGFNLRMARQLKELGIKMLYYVSPQVWAWGRGRLKSMRKMINRVLVIFPFELEVYQAAGIPVDFVGHPLLEWMEERKDKDRQRDRDLILLLPGSRAMEVQRLLVPMLETAVSLLAKEPRYRFVVLASSCVIKQKIERIMANSCIGHNAEERFTVVDRNAAYWMQKAVAGIAASGTVTVQSTISGLPLVVVYKLHGLSYLLGRLLIDVPFISMVNLIAGEALFEEFIQGRVKQIFLLPALERILPGGERREELIQGMKRVVKALESRSDKKASELAAELVVQELNKFT